MFSESLIFSLVVFVVAQVAVWGNMLSGRFGLGFAQFVATWLLADSLLVLRFVENETGPLFTQLLLVLHVLCLLGAAEFFWQRSRRRRSGFRQRRDETYGQALDAYMSGRDEEALQAFRRLFRKDPWDAQAACMVATVLARAGKPRRARRWFRCAQKRAATQLMKDEIDEEIRCLNRPRPQQPAVLAKTRRPQPKKAPSRVAG